MKKARWTPTALGDVDDYAAYITARGNPASARDWIARADELAATAAGQPRIGRVVPEFERSDLRELFFHSHRLIYRVKGAAVEVLRVWHAARRLREKDLGEEE